MTDRASGAGKAAGEGRGASEGGGAGTGGGGRLPRVGFVGLGTMGAAMAANLARAGFPLTVFNRTPGRAGQLVELGVAHAGSAREVGAASDVAVTCVPDSPQVAEVLFGPEGLAEGMAEGSLFIDCSTISPSRAREFGARLASQGVAMVDAPVSGGSEGAKAGTLTIMVAGPGRCRASPPRARGHGADGHPPGPVGLGPGG